MSHTTTTSTPRSSASRWLIVGVLGIVGILAIIAAILFITKTANSMHFLSGSIHHGIHQVRLTVCLVVGVILLAAAGYLAKSSSKSS